MTPRVAIVGTGRMGSAFAHRLSAVHPTVWNRTNATADQLRVGRVVDTAAEAVAEADVVITSVTGAPALLNRFSGPTGALSAASGQPFSRFAISKRT
ncbi:MAG TPA: NAD(P)-binding domain-containing protein [Candidatus Dormibacteraeota bacterium]|nr:NAD(P)-binding domain-containing protein [Candidatus Dormibacteraeota bacterium]